MLDLEQEATEITEECAATTIGGQTLLPLRPSAKTSHLDVSQSLPVRQHQKVFLIMVTACTFHTLEAEPRVGRPLIGF
jgi:hypothetical protein